MKHRTLDARGTRIHVVEADRSPSDGPLILLVHGFPESWYSWRHQLPVLASAGFRAVAIDVRGYGRSSAPLEIGPTACSTTSTTTSAWSKRSASADGRHRGPRLGVADRGQLGPAAAGRVRRRGPAERAVHPARAAAADRRPSPRWAASEEFYINYFQEPGRAEAEAELDVRSWLLGFYVGASGDAVAPPDGGTMATVPPGGMLRDRFVIPESLPGWLSEEDLEFYVAEFERTGFRGPLNRYRNVDRDWVDLQPWRGRPITVPSLFIGGEKDGPTIWGGRAIARFGETLPGSAGQPHPARVWALGAAGAGRRRQRPVAGVVEGTVRVCEGTMRGHER